MKAIVVEEAGSAANLIITELPVPSIGSEEVLVQVKAISINPVDTKVRGSKALQQLVMGLKEGETPVILGWDISCVIVDTGSAVRGFQIGDEVFGMVNFSGQGKAYAEYVAAPAAHLALKPANVSHEEAAAATLAALTAWQALVQYAGIKEGDKVLIHAAAGGVGHYAVQIAKQLGAYVIGTSTEANRDFVLGLGADEHIDYSTVPFEEVVSGLDVVIDSLLPAGHLEHSLQVLKDGGTLVSLNRFLDKDLDLAKAVKAKRVMAHRLEVRSDGADMKDIAEWLSKGRLKSHIAFTYPFEDMVKAHLQLETGRTVGKIVLTF